MTSASIWISSPPVPHRERPPKPERVVVSSPELGLVRSALDALPNDSDPLDYDGWRNVIFAIHHATGGSDEGLALAHEFSSRSAKYDPEFLDNRVWPYINTERGGEVITERTLYALAAQHGWQDPTTADDFDVVETQQDAFDMRIPAGLEAKDPMRFAPIPAHEFAVATQLRWIIKGVLPQAELAVLYGESGSGKTFMTLDMVAAVALGQPWRGCKVHQGSVVYIAAEGAGGFRNRLRAYAHQHQVDLTSMPLHVISAAPNMLDKTDAVDVAKAIAQVVGRPQVIVIDTLAQTMPGGNENAGEDMGKVLAHCRGLHRATGALVLLVHHSGKDASKGARGWSGLRAAADVELEVLRAEDDRVLSLTKQKDGDDGGEYGFKLETVLVDMDSDGDEVTSCVVVHGDGSRAGLRKNGPKGRNEQVVHRAVLDLLEPGGEMPDRETVLQRCLESTMAPEDGKRDTRRQHFDRALRGLLDRGLLVADGLRIGAGDV